MHCGLSGFKFGLKACCKQGLQYVVRSINDWVICTLYWQVEVSKYGIGVQWLRDLLYNVEFTWERVGVVANKMLNDIPRYSLLATPISHTHMLHLQIEA